jgi:lipid-binding SYLF domain-containing protein
MKKISILILVVAVCSWFNDAFATEMKDYSKSLQVFRDSPVVTAFFENSYGYAIFPIIGKAGFVVGGSYGEGQVYLADVVTGKSTVIEGSIGFQAGAEAFSEIVFFEDKRAYDEFTSGSFEFGATAQAVAVTAGVEAEAGTSGMSAAATAGPKTGTHIETGYHKGMASFVHAKGGLMYEFSIGGQKFTFQPL